MRSLEPGHLVRNFLQNLWADRYGRSSNSQDARHPVGFTDNIKSRMSAKTDEQISSEPAKRNVRAAPLVNFPSVFDWPEDIEPASPKRDLGASLKPCGEPETVPLFSMIYFPAMRKGSADNPALALNWHGAGAVFASKLARAHSATPANS
jgi:hypothetical protein